MRNDLDAARLIDWIHGARTFSEKKGLQNMVRMLDLLGHPERSFRAIHVAGTNGKGSVCACCERALRENGYLTGLFTSPYLRRYQERIRIGGQEVENALFIEQGNRLYQVWMDLNAEGIFPTAFELGTALAFLCFEAAGVEVAVIEVGIGGRLDPTNVIEPICCAIASIGLDHEQVLGSTLAEIAREKAGIIKPGVPVAVYPVPEPAMAVIAETARERGAPLLCAADLPLQIARQDARGTAYDTELPGFGPVRVQTQLAGSHQIRNTLLALCALALANQRGVALDPAKTLSGIAAAEWPGRLSWLGDQLLLDGAHNEQAAHALADYIRAYLPGRRVVLLTAMMRDKRPEDCAAVLSAIAERTVATQVQWPRALPAGELAELYRLNGVPAEAVPDPRVALDRAKALAAPDGIVLVCGSLYLVGDIYNMA